MCKWMLVGVFFIACIVSAYGVDCGKGARTLPDGRVGQGFDDLVRHAGGLEPLHYSTDAAKLPPGLKLDPDNGDIHGVPARAQADP